MQTDEKKYERLKQYLEVAPISLALIRGLESGLFSEVEIKRPALDIGCGDGLFASLTFKDSLDVGLDMDLKEAGKAVKKNVYHRVINGSVNAMPFPDNHFMTALSNCVFEHISPSDKAIAEVFRVLTPGGKYVFTVHSHLYDEFLYFPRIFQSLKLEFLAKRYCSILNSLFKHINCVSPQVWEARLKKAGFYRVEYRYYFPRKTQEAFDRFLCLSVFAYIHRFLFGKFVIMPRRYVWPIWGNYLKKVYEDQCELGGGIFLVAHKK